MNERQALLAIRNAVRLENLAEDVAKRVTPELRAIFDELGRQFRSMPPGNIEREIWYRQQRMRIADFFAPLNDEMRDALTEALGNEVANQMHYAESYLNSAIESPENKVAITAPQDGINVLGPSQTGNVQFTRQQLHTIAEETKVLGERMGDLFRPNLDGGGEHGKWIEQNMALIDRKVKAGFLTGMTNEQVAATLPGLGREAVRRNKAIARTALMDMSARSQEALWAANSDRVKGWEFDATMDNRVCDRCAPWDGQTQEVRGRLPTVPLHVNCRCRVLPLTATELALREEEGPQRRSVVELIEADSKEKAIELAKAKPGVVAARAYAKQVRIKGKKYWRVAEDIQRKDEPLTMGEFLRQASPATQEQVLGSAKRRRMFMEKIAGTAERPPISPDRALKEVTEWQPTVTRRPRLSMDMRLDIAKLKSQKELMKQNSEGEAHIVYGYLRAKDSGTAAAGTPYYVGIGDKYTRAFSKNHGRVPLPKDEALVRQFGVFPNRAAAGKREQELIARFGRKGIDDGGILLNRSAGGEKGGYGVKISPAVARRRALAIKQALNSGQKAQAMAERLGFDLSAYQQFSPAKKRALQVANARTGLRGEALLSVSPETAVDKRLTAMAKRLGLDPSVYKAMSQSERDTVRRRLSESSDMRRALARERLLRPEVAAAAKRAGMSVDDWMKLSSNEKEAVMARVRRASLSKAEKEAQLAARRASRRAESGLSNRDLDARMAEMERRKAKAKAEGKTPDQVYKEEMREERIRLGMTKRSHEQWVKDGRPSNLAPYQKKR